VADRPGLVVDGLGGTSTSLIRLSAFLAIALIEKPFAVLAQPMPALVEPSPEDSTSRIRSGGCPPPALS